MLCIANSAYVETAERVTSSSEAWLKDGAAMAELFADLPEAIANTAVIAQRCAVAAPQRKPILPRLSDDEDEQLRRRRACGARGAARGPRPPTINLPIANGSSSSSTSSPAWVLPAIS